MIEKLRKGDIEKAAKIYKKCLGMQNPPSSFPIEKIIKRLEKIKVFVYKENKKIKGLISFRIKDKIKIDFICALKLRKSIGKKLMNKLANFSIKNNIGFIYSRVSSKDKRVMNFYEKCGFKKYGRYYIDKNFMLYRVKADPKSIKKKLKSLPKRIP